MQVYHSNASTNLHIRNQIKKNFFISNSELAKKFSVSVPTIIKWKQRECPNDRSSKPHKIYYALSDEVQNLIVSIRKNTWSSVDETIEILSDIAPNISRSAVYRTFKKHNINTIPQEKREKAKKFKEYEPGFLHIDVTYLPKINGEKLYLFVAIDRATRLLFFKVYDKKTAENAQQFFDECINFFPFKIEKVLTDNGLEFSNKLYKSKKGNSSEKLSKFDEKLKELNVEHRLTKPCTPQTNGMVERVNGIIKAATIQKVDYKNRQELEKEMNKFLLYYNTMRRHGSLRKELNVKTPLQAFEKWAKISPNILKENPLHFQNFVLNLSRYFNPNYKQPCET